MTGQDWLWIGAFAAGLCAAGCATTAYPGLFRVLMRLGRPIPIASDLTDDDLPAVTIVINTGGADARSRVEAALAADYPADRLDILVAGVAEDFDHPRVRTLPTDPGVPLCEILSRARAEVVLVSSGDDYAAVRTLAARFLDPAVCAACGTVVLTAPDGPDRACETFVKVCEGPFGRLLGARAGLYAVRRPVFAPAACRPAVCVC